jgi:hypothetical protein
MGTREEKKSGYIIPISTARANVGPDVIIFVVAILLLDSTNHSRDGSGGLQLAPPASITLKESTPT